MKMSRINLPFLPSSRGGAGGGRATLRRALNWATTRLKNKSRSPALDSEVILSFVLKKTREFLFANPNYELSNFQLTAYNLLLRKRLRRVPIAYLTGRKEFYGLDFQVTPDVLIPRPETELLVELALDRIKNKELRIKNVVDVGTGSGCIVSTLAVIAIRHRRRSNLRFYATDNSTPALNIARANARRHGVAKKIKFIKSDLLSTLPLTIYRLPTLVLANLPYLTPQQYNSNPDLRREPHSALVSGRDGLKSFRELFAQLSVIARSQQTTKQSRDRRGLRPRDDDKIMLLLEHDPSQVSKLKSLTKKYFPSPTKITFHRDLSGRNRVMEMS